MTVFENRLRQAREMSWEIFGKRIIFFLPGMFRYNGLTGRYPAISITGDRCVLQCDHCRGRILEPMIHAPGPDILVKQCLRLADRGALGILISGGSDEEGCLPWPEFLQAIEEVKKRTDLFISVHCGFLDEKTALRLKKAGVDQALMDVIGTDETCWEVCHVESGVSRILSTLEALERAGLPMVPHIVCGLHCGAIRGEKKAIEMICRFRVEQVVVVSLMGIAGTPFHDIKGPEPEQVAEVIVESRLRMPSTPMSFGCARQRGSVKMELLAIDAGVNRMALPSQEAIGRAMEHGLEIHYQRTCCSVPGVYVKTEW